MRTRKPFLALFPVILAGSSGCDNVQWEGASIGLESPFSDQDSLAENDSTLARPPEFEGIDGPLLYSLTTEGDQPTLVPIGVIGPTGLREVTGNTETEPLDATWFSDRVNPGAEFSLFAQGTRVGTFISDGATSIDPSFCSARPAVSGRVELLDQALGLGRFLAVSEDSWPNLPFRGFQPLVDTRAERSATIDLLIAFLNTQTVAWPTDLVGARRALDLFPIDGGATPAIAATFLYEDRLNVSTADDASHSVFILAEPSAGGYRTTFQRLRVVGEEGKGAPRFHSTFDWDRDGEDEILLEVFGGESRWFLALDRDSDGWKIGYQDSCGAPTEPAQRP